ncbi:MAG: LysM peptidoglycan-binding domain-containing protein [Chitinispirillales bacterium]|nr:LysM peptidoglycan-binding domain-containing protein [Chitinispirillales bacterium]
MQVVLLLLMFIPMTVFAQGERYDLSLGDYYYPKYNTLDTNIPNYTIVKGDNLWNLALRFYDAGVKWSYIWEHNRYIKDPHWIYPGNPLFIPGLSQTVQQESFDSLNDYVEIDVVETQELVSIDISPEVEVETETEINADETEEAVPIDVNPEVKSGKKRYRYFVFSLRPEALIRPEKFNENSVMALGANMELGAISAKGFYFSLDLSGGKFYYGGGFDIGGCLGRNKAVKSVLGICGGYWNIVTKADVKKNGYVLIDSAKGNNVSYGGGLWKLMFGRTGNFDITNKVLIGPKKDDPVDYSENSKTFIYDTSLNLTWSASVGFTLTKKKKRLGK